MGVSQNRGPQYSTLNSRILVIRTPKIRYPNFRKVPDELRSKVVGFLPGVAGLPVEGPKTPNLRMSRTRCCRRSRSIMMSWPRKQYGIAHRNLHGHEFMTLAALLDEIDQLYTSKNCHIRVQVAALLLALWYNGP